MLNRELESEIPVRLEDGSKDYIQLVDYEDFGYGNVSGYSYDMIGDYDVVPNRISELEKDVAEIKITYGANIDTYHSKGNSGYPGGTEITNIDYSDPMFSYLVEAKEVDRQALIDYCEISDNDCKMLESTIASHMKEVVEYAANEYNFEGGEYYESCQGKNCDEELFVENELDLQFPELDKAGLYK